MLASSGYVVYALLAKLVWNQDVPRGFTALIVAIVFMAGVQLLFLGILGEYVGRIYEEVKRRPIYLVEEVVRGADRTPTEAAEATEAQGAATS